MVTRVKGVLGRLVALWCVFTALMGNPALAEELTLEGIAEYHELNKRYYIAAYYTSENNAHSQMLIKVQAKRWSKRKWRDHWQNNIAINNPQATDEELTSALNEFKEFPWQPFRMQDEIRILKTDEKGTQVFFNEGLVLKSGPELFEFLFNTWRGKFPPSRDFRDRITGRTAVTPRLAELLDVPVEQERMDLVAQRDERLAQEAYRIEQARLAKEEAAKQKAAKQKEQKLAQAAALKKQQALEKQKEISQAELKTAIVQAPKIERDTAIEKELFLETGGAAITQVFQQQAKRQRYLSDLYHWRIQQAVDQAVSYPEEARSSGQQGLVKLQVSINSAGDIIAQQNRSEGASNILVEEVESKIAKALSRIEKPEKLLGKQWQFLIQYQFKLTGRRDVVMQEPTMPAGLR